MNDLPGEDKLLPTEELPENEEVTSEVSDVEETPAEEPVTDTVTESESEVVSEGSNSEKTAEEAEKPSSDEEKKPEKKAPAKTKKKRKKKTAKDFAIEFFIKIAITAAAVVILLIFVVGIHVNHGNASYPMIKDGDLVITYKLGKPGAGEEIAYKHDGELKFGRIVAKEGDEVRITDQCITVNGYNIVEDVVYPTTAEGSAISYPYIVPQGTVFVLNDYRSDPGDSRTYGAIPMSDVEGEVILVLRRRGI